MDQRNRRRALQIAKNLLESRINAIEAARALIPFLRADPTIAMPEDRKALVGIDKETDDLPVGRIREECHPDILLERDKEIERYERLYGDKVRSICERIVQNGALRP
jgi:hypothetical protein